jgi:hypothetical protein
LSDAPWLNALYCKGKKFYLTLKLSCYKLPTVYYRKNPLSA